MFPLTKAVRAHDLAEVLRQLRGPCKGDADFERDDEQKMTPLFWAARDGQLAIASALLACGADPKATDADGTTPLDYARRMKQGDMIALLEALTRAKPKPAAPTAKSPSQTRSRSRGKHSTAATFNAVILSPSPLRYRVEVPKRHGAALGAQVRVALNGATSIVRRVETVEGRRFVRLLARDLPEGTHEGSKVRVELTPFPA